MDDKELQKITAFDTLFTTNQIQILKILITYLSPSSRKDLAIYIKFLELHYTISFFKKNPNASILHTKENETGNTFRIFDEILPLCNPSEQEKLQKMRSMYQNFENMQEMMQMMQLLQEMSPDGAPPFASFMENNGTAPDISELFRMFSSEETE